MEQHIQSLIDNIEFWTINNIYDLSKFMANQPRSVRPLTARLAIVSDLIITYDNSNKGRDMLASMLFRLTELYFDIEYSSKLRIDVGSFDYTLLNTKISENLTVPKALSSLMTSIVYANRQRALHDILATMACLLLNQHIFNNKVNVKELTDIHIKYGYLPMFYSKSWFKRTLQKLVN